MKCGEHVTLVAIKFHYSTCIFLCNGDSLVDLLDNSPEAMSSLDDLSHGRVNVKRERSDDDLDSKFHSMGNKQIQLVASRLYVTLLMHFRRRSITVSIQSIPKIEF